MARATAEIGLKSTAGKGKRAGKAMGESAVGKAQSSARSAAKSTVVKTVVKTKKQANPKPKKERESLPAETPDAPDGEIDALFARRRPAEGAKGKEGAPDIPAQAPTLTQDDGFFDSRGTRDTRQFTPDGYPVYDAKALRIGEGEGDTPACPFDCTCCY